MPMVAALAIEPGKEQLAYNTSMGFGESIKA
jgi:hypothetical protein